MISSADTLAAATRAPRVRAKEQAMGIGGGIFLIVVGAILAFGVSPDAWEVFNLNIIGYICIGAGILMIVFAMMALNRARHTTHSEYVERRDIHNPPPPAY
jgi:hypothetical protein